MTTWTKPAQPVAETEIRLTSPEEQTMTPADEIHQAAESLRPGAPYATSNPPKWLVSLRTHVGGEVFEILDGTHCAIKNGECPVDRLGPVLRLARRINEATR